MTSEKKTKQKIDRAFDIQCLQYWQASKMVRLGINPSTNEPLNQSPHETLAFITRWLELLVWTKPLYSRMIALKAIVEKEVQEYDEQKLQANS